MQRAAGPRRVPQPPVIPRSVWGAGEPFHLDREPGGQPPEFWPMQKLIVHHTAGGSDHDDPAAAVRWIHRFHTVRRGWGDLGYNFIVDYAGAVYEGRFSGERGEGDPVGVDAGGRAVAAAHTGGFNAGTIGIAVLGDFSDSPIRPEARNALVALLAWAAATAGLDPEGSGSYVNPLNGSRASLPNIAGHRDIADTDCPGERLYADLPRLRAEVADLRPAPTSHLAQSRSARFRERP